MSPKKTPLRRLREKRGLRTVHLAAAADISVQALHVIESGRGFPKLETAQRIAAALGVTVDELWPPTLHTAHVMVGRGQVA